MANEIKLTLRVDDNGSLNIVAKEAEKAAKSTDKLDQSTKKTNKSRSNYNKTEKGVAGATSNSTKAFTKQASSISGGLVPAYAVLAANIFAITAAFGALQRAAQVEQLTAGLTALGRASGLAMQTLSAGLVEATGHALSLEEAMRSTALITSAGLDPSSIQRFGEVARNASVALGRDTADSLARLTRGITKLEPELLDELGIMIRIDEATQKYASALGKSASDLSNFEKRQAFLNATLEQGEKKFSAIGGEVDTNPYDKLAATFLNLSKVILGTINTALTPLVAFLASSPTALFGVLTAFAGTIVGKMIPAFSDLENSAIESAIASEEMGKAQLKSLGTLEGGSAKVKEYVQALEAGTATTDQYDSALNGNATSISKREASLKKLTGTENAYFKILKLTVTGQKAEAKALKDQLVVTKQAVKIRDTLIRSTYDQAKSDAQLGTAKALLAFEQEGLVKGLKKGTANLKEQGKAMVAGIAQSSALGAASIFASGALGLMGSAALFAGKAISMIAPWITGIAIAMSILAPIFSYITDLFTSDASKKYAEQSEALSTTMDELALNAREVDLAIMGQSNTIQTASQRWTAFSNILSQFTSEYSKLAAAGREAGDFDEQEAAIQRLLDSSNMLRVAFEAEFGTDQIDELNGSIRQNVTTSEAFIETQLRNAESLKGLSVTLNETTQSFSDFLNATKIQTPIDNIVASVQDIANQLDSASKGGSRLAGILSEMSGSQATILNTGEQVAGIKELDSQIQIAQKKVADAENVSMLEWLKNYKKRKTLNIAANAVIEKAQKQQDILASIIVEQIAYEKELLETEQKRQQLAGTSLQVAKLGKEILSETMANGVAQTEKQLVLDKEITALKVTDLTAQIAYQQKLKGQTKDLEQQAAFQAKINVLIKEKALVEAKANSLSEDAVALQNARIAALKDEQTASKAILDIANRAASVESARISTAEKAAKLAAKQANRKDPSRTTGAALLPSDEAKIAKDLLQRRLDASKEEERLKKIGLNLEMAMLNAKLLGTRAELQVIKEKGGNITESDLAALDSAIASIAVNGELRTASETAITEQYTTQRDLLNDNVESTNILALQAQERINEENKLLAIRKEMNTVTSKGVEALAEANKIQEDISKLANTNVMGNLISAKEAARIAEVSRQQELGVAQQKYNLAVEMAGIQADILSAEYNLLSAKFAADGITTQAEKNLLDATGLLLEAKIRVSNLELKNTKEGIRLLKDQQSQDRNQSIATAAATGGTGPTGTGAIAVTKATQGTVTAINANKDLSDEDKKAQIAEAQKAAARGLLESGAADLAKLGPEGALASSAIQGALTINDAFTTAFKDMEDAGPAGKFAAMAGAIGQSIGAVASIQQASANARVAAIDKEIAAEQKRDGKSQGSLEKIKAMEKKKQQVQKKAFEQNKKMQMAQTVANTAAGMIGVLAGIKDPFVSAPLAFAQMGIIGAMGAVSLAAIAGTSYQGGGSVPSASGGTPSSISIGQRGTTTDLAKSKSAGGELAYFRGAQGQGGAENFKPAFTGAKYRANGGQTAGYVVGEQGPELFVPETPGTILPNDGDGMTAAPANVNFSISALDSSGVEDILTQQRGNIIGMIREAANSYGQDFVEGVDTSVYTPSAGGVSKY